MAAIKHLKSDHSKTYPCLHCGRVFNNRANMRRHALIKHSGEFEKKFQCELCGRRYAIKQSLRIVISYNLYMIHPLSPDKGHPNRGHFDSDWLKVT